MFSSIKEIFSSCHVHERAYEIIRIYLGIGLFIKGIHFMTQPQDLVYFITQGQLNILESLLSHYIISAHLVGGLLLAVGLLTRLGAFIQVPILLGAVGLVHMNDHIFSINQNIEFSALVLLLLCIIMVVGGGGLSVDNYLKRHNTI